jgi:hypothetical protein
MLEPRTHRIGSHRSGLHRSGLFGRGSHVEDQAIFNPQDLLKMEDLLKDQKQALAAENKEKELYRKFGI